MGRALRPGQISDSRSTRPDARLQKPRPLRVSIEQQRTEFLGIIDLSGSAISFRPERGGAAGARSGRLARHLVTTGCCAPLVLTSEPGLGGGERGLDQIAAEIPVSEMTPLASVALPRSGAIRVPLRLVTWACAASAAPRPSRPAYFKSHGSLTSRMGQLVPICRSHLLSGLGSLKSQS